MIGPVLLLAAQAPAAAVPVLGSDTQLSCTLIGPGDRAPTRLDLDFRSKKAPNAVLAFAGESAFARVGSTSEVQRRTDGTYVIGFATGSGQYRLELTPQGQAARLRVASVLDRSTRLTMAQGYCATRRGKRLGTKPVVALPIDDVIAPRPWKLTPMPGRLPNATCRIVSREGRVSQLSYEVATVQGNELTANYRFGAGDPRTVAVQLASGTQFYLVAPAERMVATTLSLGGNPTTFVHITYERMGNFIDLSRNGEVFAVGECGQPPIWVATASGAAR